MQIILCSDNPAVRDAVAGQIGEGGARLTVCQSSMELLAAVRALAADVVIMDLGTHGIGGLLLVSAVQELAPGVPILAVSATAEVDARQVIQKGIPHVLLDGEHSADFHTLVFQLADGRGVAVGPALR